MSAATGSGHEVSEDEEVEVSGSDDFARTGSGEEASMDREEVVSGEALSSEAGSEGDVTSCEEVSAM